MFTSGGIKELKAQSRLERAEKSELLISRLHERLHTGNKNFTRFVYASEQEFYSQFVDRPGETEILKDDNGNFGIIERGADTNLLQLCLAAAKDVYPITLIEALIEDALTKQRKLFLYSTQPDLDYPGKRLGLEVKTGYVTALVSDESRLREALKVGMTSKIENTSALSDADSQWFLGNWNIQSGDRA
jgi:hypothetical protein